jgi:ribose 1,5-bisphosphokinase
MYKLFYIIGASGVGKDSLMNYARTIIDGAHMVQFAHRYITRPALVGNENHISLTEKEFEARKALQLFAMHWNSHDQQYGIGTEINTWMKNGGKVVINGSREYLATAQSLYPQLIPILITATPDIILQRLISRNREDADTIQKRFDRNKYITTNTQGCILLENNNALEDAGNKLAQLIIE